MTYFPGLIRLKFGSIAAAISILLKRLPIAETSGAFAISAISVVTGVLIFSPASTLTAFSGLIAIITITGTDFINPALCDGDGVAKLSSSTSLPLKLVL